MENGAIDVLPGTNREFYKFWRYAVERKYRLTTRVPLRQGDVILRKSTHVAPRHAEPHDTPAADDGDHVRRGRRLRAAIRSPYNDGKIRLLPELVPADDRLGRLRERTFVTAPITYSAYRFARSLYGNKGYASF